MILIPCLLLTFPRKPHLQTTAACPGPHFLPSKTPDVTVDVHKQALSSSEVLGDCGAAPCAGPYGPQIPGETHYMGVLPTNGGKSPDPRSTNGGEVRQQMYPISCGDSTVQIPGYCLPSKF